MPKHLPILLAGLILPLSFHAAAAPPLPDHGPAPELSNVSGWINSPPLTMAGLRGKVVLVEFWTYSCVNCLRNLPHVSRWHNQYRQHGLSVVGIHTPEYSFEKDARNVAAAVKRFDVHYAVAQDNHYATWNAYANKYWPAVYLVDRKGRIRYKHFGEGEYRQTGQAIQQLLAEQ